MKKILLLIFIIVVLSGCTQFKGFVETNKYTPPQPEANQKTTSGVNMNFAHGEPPQIINGKFLVTLEFMNFLMDSQSIELTMWQTNDDLRLIGEPVDELQSIAIDGAEYNEDTGKFVKATKYVKSYGPLEFSEPSPGAETTFNAEATYDVSSEGLVMQFCVEEKKVQKDQADSCSYTSRITGDGFTRNPITINGFRSELRSDGRGSVLATLYFDVSNKGPGKATGEGIYEEVKFDLSSADDSNLNFDCRKEDASANEEGREYTRDQLPMTLYLENGKASLVCTTEISLMDVYKKEDYNLEFHMDYGYKVRAMVSNIEVKG